LSFAGCKGKESTREVVVYTSLDKVFSQPVLEAFEKQTGIKVLPVYDSEATKTTGLVNRLIAEKDSPQADVFWNSETGRTIVLKRKGVLAIPKILIFFLTNPSRYI
jgi:iron(III) transport system substrate-binding protein